MHKCVLQCMLRQVIILADPTKNLPHGNSSSGIKLNNIISTILLSVHACTCFNYYLLYAVYVAVAVSGIIAIIIACSIILSSLCFVIINMCERKPESGKLYIQDFHNNYYECILHKLQQLHQRLSQWLLMKFMEM